MSNLHHRSDSGTPFDNTSRATDSMTTRIQHALHAGNDDMTSAMTAVIEAIGSLHSNLRGEIDRLRNNLEQAEVDRSFNEVT